MRFKCDKCGTEFKATIYVECPKCGEHMKARPMHTYQHTQTEVPEKHVKKDDLTKILLNPEDES